MQHNLDALEWSFVNTYTRCHMEKRKELNSVWLDSFMYVNLSISTKKKKNGLFSIITYSFPRFKNLR